MSDTPASRGPRDAAWYALEQSGFSEDGWIKGTRIKTFQVIDQVLGAIPPASPGLSRDQFSECLDHEGVPSSSNCRDAAMRAYDRLARSAGNQSDGPSGLEPHAQGLQAGVVPRPSVLPAVDRGVMIGRLKRLRLEGSAAHPFVIISAAFRTEIVAALTENSQAKP